MGGMPDVIRINSGDFAMRLAREALLGWHGSLDAKRPRAWDQFGYSAEITFAQLLTAYMRGGPGHGAVHRLLDRCWLRRPRIKRPEEDAESDWEDGVERLMRPLWRRLRDFDRRNMVGRYAGLIYRVADGRALREPIGRAQRLVDVVPVFEDQLRVTAWDSDPASERFGQPTMWQYRMRPPHGVDTQGAPDQWVDVHPSRVQIMAEGSAGGDFFDGVPLLRAGFNHLVDLEKIAGGSGESFLKNSARTPVFEFEKDSPVQQIASQDGTGAVRSVRDVLTEQSQELNRNLDATIVLQGGKANTLQTTIADPTGAWLLAANLFAASVQIPFTVLFGQQTGRLASDEDKADFNARCASRQENELTPMLEEFVARMQAVGLIEDGEFEVEWKPLDAPGEKDKAGLLVQYTTAMKQAFDAGLTEPLFDANELRNVADFEERPDDGMPQEGEPRIGDDPPEVVPAQRGPRLAAAGGAA